MTRQPYSFISFESRFCRQVLAGLMAASFFISTIPASFAQAIGDVVAGPVNTTNNGQVVQSGTYYNTPDGRTVFMNSNAGGLWLKSGSTVTGLEVDAGSALTGNGGSLLFYAPGSVVRLDGNINVNGLMNGGAYVGNGGKVFVDSAFLYQNGNIFANGKAGGMVQFNVNSAVLGPNARIEARGFTNGGGIVDMNATDFVDIQRGALVDTSGRVIPGLDSNIINVEASLINVEGVLKANGTVVSSDGGTIRLIANGDTSNCFGCTLDSVRMINTTQAGLPIAEDVFTNTEYTDLIARRNFLLSGSTRIADGSVYVSGSGRLYANGISGVNAGNGGNIYLAAANDIWNDGVITANGGNGASGLTPSAGGDGGLVTLTALDDVVNTCLIEANGGNGGDNTTHISLTDANNTTFDYLFNDPQTNTWNNLGPVDATVSDASTAAGANGGNGGTIAIGYGGDMRNTDRIRANGGHGGNGGSSYAEDTVVGVGAVSSFAGAVATSGKGGDGGNGGLIVFSGSGNPTGGGTIVANGGNGGRGGDAEAFADASSRKHAGAIAKAYAGHGGQGGGAGTVVAPNPGSFTATQNYSAKAGNEGHSGDATATAIGGAAKNVPGKAYTWFGHAIADANTGNYGTATANATAYGVDASRADARAVSGDHGTSIANADADGKWYVYANGYAEGGDYSNATSNADARSEWTNRSDTTAYAKSKAKVGIVSDANSTAIAYSEYSGAEADSHAWSDDFSNATSFAQAEGEDYVHAKSVADSGLVGNSDSTAIAIQHGDVNIDPYAESYAISGDYGTSISRANARGNWYTEAKAHADSGLAGTSEAYSDADSFIAQAVSEANATSGDYGQSKADAKARSMHRNKSADATAIATSGDYGISNAKSEAITQMGWNKIANSNAKAISGNNGESNSEALSSGYSRWNSGKAYSNANSITGLNGSATANAQADGKTFARANADANGNSDTASGPGLQVASASDINVIPGYVRPPAPLAPTAPVPTNNAIEQTQDDELIIHGNSAALLSKGGSATSLDSRLGSAIVRDVANPTGGATHNAGNTTDLVVANNSGTDLILDQQGYGQLDNMAVLNKGNVTNPQALNVDNSVNLIATGSFDNNDVIQSGSVYVRVAGDVNVNADITTTDTYGGHGGSVIIKSHRSIVNNATISSNGSDVGGQVHLSADDDIINLDTITANANQQAGIVVAKAGELNINAGLVEASADQGRGGYVHLHADNVTANFDTVQSNGGNHGGRVLMTAGDKDQSNNNRGVNKTGVVKTLFDAEGGDTVFGFSVQELTPYLDPNEQTLLQTSIDTTQAESVYNFGDVNAQSQAAGGDGNVYLAGNNQFGIANGSHFNGVEVDVDGILAAPSPNTALQTTMRHVQDNGGEVFLVAGQEILDSQGKTVTAVQAVACDAGPNNIEPDANRDNKTRQGSQFPNDFKLLDPKTPETPERPDSPQFGLFQQDRLDLPEVPHKVVITMSSSNASTANALLAIVEGAPASNAIMAMALEEVQAQLAQGQTVEESKSEALIALAVNGLDSETALAVVQHIEEELAILGTQDQSGASTAVLALALVEYHNQLGNGAVAEQAIATMITQLESTVTTEVATAIASNFQAVELDGSEEQSAAQVFMASTYLPVTEEILALALDEYIRQLSKGETIQEAYRHTKLYLDEAGVDVEIAKLITEQVESGTIKADGEVMKVIDSIISEAEVETPTPQGDTLTQ